MLAKASPCKQQLVRGVGEVLEEYPRRVFAESETHNPAGARFTQ
jgi:hypothetical protein